MKLWATGPCPSGAALGARGAISVPRAEPFLWPSKSIKVSDKGLAFILLLNINKL